MTGYVFESAAEARALADYDLEFPEWVRLAAFAGAELLCAPVIAGPDGVALARPARHGESRVLVASCDLAEARVKRTGARNDVFADRRPELYGPVAGRPPGP